MSNKIINYLSTILLPKQLIITFNGNTYQILRTADGFKQLYQATKDKDLNALERLLNKYGYIKHAIKEVAVEFHKIEEAENMQESVPSTTSVQTKKYNQLQVNDNGQLIINGVTFNNTITRKIADMYYAGYDIQAYYKLLKKIAENVESVVQSGLLDFIAQNDLPITTNGTFLAYKVTKADGYDYHTGKVKYTVGDTVTMDRNMVSKDRDECSGPGLYFASIGYYNHHFQQNDNSAQFIVEVDPLDVVSIPKSYQNSKGRCCKMNVIKQVDWDPTLIPTSATIIDLSTWAGVKPTTTKKVKIANTGKTEIKGTQKLVKSPEVVVFKTKLRGYIERRHKEGINPTLRNAQKAVNIKGTSIDDIRTLAEQLGFAVHGGRIVLLPSNGK